MAAVNGPTPGLFAATLHALSSTAPRSQSIASHIDDLADGLAVAQAQYLPTAMSEVLPLLRRDPERLHFAVEIAVRLDLFEVVPAVVNTAVSMGDPQLLTAAATLCGNPAVDRSLRKRVADLIGSDRTALIRIDPATTPATADEKYLYWQCWPGACVNNRSPRDMPVGLAPVVVLDTRSDPLRSLRLATRLDRVGAVVRRLAPDGEIPLWFGSHTVLVCEPRTRTRVLSAFPRFPEAQIITRPLPNDDRGLSSLLRRINNEMPGPQKLRLGGLPPEVAENLWAPEIFKAGVYRTNDVAFLSGRTRSSLDYVRRRNLLTPLSSSAIRWAFGDLVAFRTWSYLRSISPGRVSSRVIPALARFAGDEKAVKLGVASDGAVLVDHGDGWVNVDTGQRPFDLVVTDIDDVFQPFSFGGGMVLPLLEASPNTKLHPSVLHGTPYLRGYRVSAKSLAGLDQRYGRSAILSTYPELEAVAFEDTVNIGHQLLSAH